MTHVTCRLTAKNRDWLRNLTLGNRVWATFLCVVNTCAVRAVYWQSKLCFARSPTLVVAGQRGERLTETSHPINTLQHFTCSTKINLLHANCTLANVWHLEVALRLFLEVRVDKGVETPRATAIDNPPCSCNLWPPGGVGATPLRLAARLRDFCSCRSECEPNNAAE